MRGSGRKMSASTVCALLRRQGECDGIAAIVTPGLVEENGA